jgi:hypothetical protein
MAELGIRPETTANYTPQQNGLAEKGFDVIWADTRSLLADAILPDEFWWFAFETACKIRNICLSASLPEGKTPHELFTGAKPSLDAVRVFGCRAYAYVSKDEGYKMKLGNRKTQPRAIRGIFVGYATNSKAWMVYSPEMHKLFKTRTVVFDEATPGGVADQTHNNQPTFNLASGQQVTLAGPDHEGDSDGQGSIHQPFSVNVSDTTATTVPQQLPVAHQDPPATRVEQTIPNDTDTGTQPSIEFPKDIHTNELGSALAARDTVHHPEEDPTTIRQALRCAHGEDWQRAIDAETNNLRSRGTFEVIERKPNMPTVKTKWVLKSKKGKSGRTFKARLVAKGFTQVHGRDYSETYAPVTSRLSLRVFSAIASQTTDMRQAQIDIKGAYLWSPLTETIYLEPPEGMDISSDKVLLLKKSLYGLKQAGHNWHATLRASLTWESP